MNLKKNIVLIGMPASGKSTIGVILAKVIGYNFLDTDILIQEKENRKLCEIIEKEGIDGFLDIENKTLASVDVKESVIATGGSAVYGTEAMDNLKKISTVIYLKVPYDILLDRLNDIKQRGVVIRKGQTFKDLYDERCKLYERYADIVIDEKNNNVEEILSMITDKCKDIDFDI